MGEGDGCEWVFGGDGVDVGADANSIGGFWCSSKAVFSV